MKILLLANHLRGDDGWSRYALDLARAFQAAGHEVLCAVHTVSEGHGIPERAVFGNPLRYLANPFASFVASRAVKKIIKEFSPDVIHCVVEPYATIFPFLISGTAVRALTVHGTYAFLPAAVSGIRARVALWMWKRALRSAHRVIAVSNFTKAYVLERMRLAMHDVELAGKLIVVTNGIEMPGDGNDYSVAGRKQNNAVRQILFVGEVKPRKGVLEAIRGPIRYRDIYGGNFLFTIVGAYRPEDSYVEALRKEIVDNHFEKNVLFAGRVSNAQVRELYRQSDALLMLSVPDGKKIEGFGLVYLEANREGVPCIGSLHSGAEDAIQDGVSGYLVDPFRPDEVAERLHRILDERMIQAENCVAWAREHDIKKKAEEILALYQKG